MKKLKTVRKRSIWFVVLGVLFFIWLGCRIYVDQQLKKVSNDIHDEHTVFEYGDTLKDDQELQGIIRQDFLDTLTHVTIAQRKDAYMFLSQGNILGGLYTVADYSDTIPYKIAYFYEALTLPFGKKVWQKDKHVTYLDVLSIEDLEGKYRITVTPDNMEEIKKNRAKIINGEIKLRAENFDEIAYAELTKNHFYTYQKDTADKASPYTYIYMREGYDPAHGLEFIFRYEASSRRIYVWEQMSKPKVEPYNQEKIIVTQTNQQLLENINNRKNAGKGAPETSQNLEDFVLIDSLSVEEGSEPYLTFDDFNSSYSKEWREAIIDPDRKAESASELFVNLSSWEAVPLYAKYAREIDKDLVGRAGLEEARAQIIKDLNEHGESSIYYQWLNELSLYNPTSGGYLVDFGDGIKNGTKQ